MKVFAFIIAGGSGERLWPLSTPERPKQFVSLFGGKPLIRHAMDRLSGLVDPERTFVVTSASLVAQTRRALPALPRKNVLAEPCRRNTAPAVALAVREAKCRGGDDAVCCILTADQLMDPVSAFRHSLRKAVRLAAKSGDIVTLGIKPTYAATGFGYIDSAVKPPRFVEKPDAATARRFLRKGTFLWNSGMFFFRVETMERALREFAPDTARLLDVKDWKRIYPSLKSISIDYAVMEHTSDLAVLPAAFRWDDVGSWNSIPNRFPHDEDGNIRLGRTAIHESKDSLVLSTDDHLTAVLGLKEVVVVHTDKATLVCARSRAQEVRKLLAKMSLCLMAALGFTLSSPAERYPYERYKSVVDRQMFGAVPEGFDPSRPPSEALKSGSKAAKELTKEQEKVKSSVRFSAINVTPSGDVAVGFTDSSNPKEVRHYYLKVGESRDGWEVKAADPLKATVTIAKDNITLDLELGAKSNPGNAVSAAAPAAVGGENRSTNGLRMAPRPVAGASDVSAGGGSMLSSLRARRRLREEAAKADAEARARADAEAQVKAEEQKVKAEEEKAKAEEEKNQIRQQLSELMEQRRQDREERERQKQEAQRAAESRSDAEADPQ